MARSSNFWKGVEQMGVGASGIYGAYALAASWGSTASFSGILAGSCGVILGGIGGAFLGALVLPLALAVVAAAVEVISSLAGTMLSGAANMFSM